MIPCEGKLKLVPLFLSAFISCASLSAQTLFTCAGNQVSKDDFLKAYNKNNNGAKPTEKSYRDYLDLYIRYKLKVREAYAMQLDTLQSQKVELQSFRDQIAGSFLRDDASFEKLTTEAFERGQHDLRIAHIFIAVPDQAKPADTLRASQQAWAAYAALKRGRSFRETAIAYSEDPSVKQNGGEIGYISLFSLPYELESLAYTTPVGQYSKPYRSRGGYHIFKVLSERKAAGRMKVAQILFAFPPDLTDEKRAELKRKADSVYQALNGGADFAKLAASYSGDNMTYQHGGEMNEFGVGKYDSAFEAAAFGLDRDGAISKPLATAFGYHIIKRIYRKSFPTVLTKDAKTALQQEITADARMEVSRKALLNRIWQQAHFRRGSYSASELWAFTDSALNSRPQVSVGNIDASTVLFSFPGRSYAVRDWIDFALPYRNVAAGRKGSYVPRLFDQFVERSSMDYYRAHLEEYDADFAFQLNEFRDGNLLFEVMQRKVWDKASTDSAGLHNYYNAHKEKYWWGTSADALLFTCADQQSAQALKAKVQADRWRWRAYANEAGAAVQADSGRYELAQLPGATKSVPGIGTFTDMTGNKNDNTVSFSYILNLYSQPAQREFRDARGFVINDYQGYLEEQWIASLKKKYPVTIDERVFAGLPK